MFADLKAVMWKEYVEIFRTNGDRRQAFVKLLLFIVIITVFLPISMADIESQISAWFQLWYLIPAVTTMGIIPDAFAGERERHTLATLLASRLNVRAIALGKMAIAVIYAWSVTMLLSLSLLIKINLSDRSQKLEFYPSDFFISGSSGSLLLSILVASVGVLVCDRAESIKQAYRRVITAVMLLNLVPLLVMLAIGFFLPLSVRQNVANFLFQTNYMTIAIRLLCLAILDSCLIALVLRLFKRTRLMSS